MRQTRFEQYGAIQRRDIHGLRVVLGTDESGKALYTSLSKAPQTLVAGTTGSGKSNLLHVMICSILAENPLYSEMILIDPKHGAEFSIYDGMRNVHVMDNSEDAMKSLEWATNLIDARFRMFSEIGANDIDAYNQKSGYYVHPVLIVIDELADLIMTSKKQVQSYIIRIGQLGRAAGVHLVVATQTPRREVVTGMIKANLPCKIAMSVSSSLESRIVIDRNGAEKLCGKGDALFTKGGAPIHFQAPYISRSEIATVIAIAKRQQEAHPNEVMPEMKIKSLAERRMDSYANEASRQTQQAKADYLNRKLEEAKMRMFWWRL